MILIQAAALSLGLAAADTILPQRDSTTVVRRITSTALLAAQEYALGVRDGRIVLAPEVAEARLFLEEARRAAGALPVTERARTVASLDSVIRMVAATASPDSVSRRVRLLTTGVAGRLGVSLDETPAQPPVLARGAEIYRKSCAGCHGDRGLGDGRAGVGLDPAPTNLADADALRDASPLDFYRRITIGVAGTAMPAFEASLPANDRWAVAAYASLLRLPPPAGTVPDSLRDFRRTAALSDAALLPALNIGGDPRAALGRLAAVRAAGTDGPSAGAARAVFAQVRRQLDSAVTLAELGEREAAESRALDAYITFEQVEQAIRTRDGGLAAELEAGFAELRARAGSESGAADLPSVRSALGASLVRAERTFDEPMSALGLFTQSFVLLLREGLEAILIVGALLTFLVRTGAPGRRRDIHLGVGAAIAASALTALLIETIFHVSPAHRELLEGITMVLATAMLFYVSYWLLSKLEVVKWTHFVKSRVQDAVTSGSTLALASAAFLAVYREGFETILFYKAIFVGAGNAGIGPAVAGMLAGAVVLLGVYVAINRFGVRLPLKPFFGMTSAFLYLMAFIFAGKGVAELQAARVVSTTYAPWAPNFPSLGIYPTIETLLVQALLLALAAGALVWTFVVAPRRLPVTSVMLPEATGRAIVPMPAARSNRELIRSLERIDADLAEVRSELERMRGLISGGGSRLESAEEDRLTS